MNTSRQPTQSAQLATISLFESSDVVESLGRIVKRLHAIAGDHEDLMQEARIHLWVVETERPNQTVNWYLQNCRFYLRNVLAAGRSVDSFKRRHAQVDLDQIHEPVNGPEESEVGAQEMMGLLSARLKCHERLVLDALADGVGVNEIGRRLGMAHSSVIKIRAKIRKIAVCLGMESPGRRLNGKK